MEPYVEEFIADFKEYSQLSYLDNADEYVTLLIDSIFATHIYVYTDEENNNREYISINNEVIYLDTIRCENSF